MKLLHLTDPHIVAPGSRLFGIDTAARLGRCVESINRLHHDANLVVITGDLTDRGTEEEYRHLRQILKSLGVPAILLLGNHDDREVFKRVFPEQPLDNEGFVQSTFELDDTLLVFLDSKDDKGSGRICEERLEFLNRALSNSEADTVMVFLHHPALSVGVRHFETMELDDSAQFLEVLQRDGRCTHLFCGHVHLPVLATRGGIVQSAGRGIGHHIVLDCDGRDARFVASEPAYDVILVDGISTIVHRMDFLEVLPVISVSRGKELSAEVSDAA